jgi:hypothetical protein
MAHIKLLCGHNFNFSLIHIIFTWCLTNQCRFFYKQKGCLCIMLFSMLLEWNKIYVQKSFLYSVERLLPHMPQFKYSIVIFGTVGGSPYVILNCITCIFYWLHPSIIMCKYCFHIDLYYRLYPTTMWFTHIKHAYWQPLTIMNVFSMFLTCHALYLALAIH